VICETKRIWSHCLLLDREKSLPNVTLSLRKGAEPLQPIDATTPWRGFVEQITLPPRDQPAALTVAEAGLQGLSAAC
jgi:hypothetical protein